VLGVQDVLARFKEKHAGDWALLPEKAIFQMNDTHPTIAVAELMRLLIDQEGLDWDTAWGITQKVRCSLHHLLHHTHRRTGRTVQSCITCAR
jgi:starch phosphorylase